MTDVWGSMDVADELKSGGFVYHICSGDMTSQPCQLVLIPGIYLTWISFQINEGGRTRHQKFSTTNDSYRS